MDLKTLNVKEVHARVFFTKIKIALFKLKFFDTHPVLVLSKTKNYSSYCRCV